MKRLMLLATRSPEQALKLAFDKQAALEALSQRQTVIPFWCDCTGASAPWAIAELHQNLKDFTE